MIFVEDRDLTIHVGDVRDVLPTLPDESVDCVATSPPFYGLRDYGTGTWEGGDPGCDHSTPRSRGDDIRLTPCPDLPERAMLSKIGRYQLLHPRLRTEGRYGRNRALMRNDVW